MITWAAFMKSLGAENLTWVPAEIMQAAGVTEFELPLFRTERGARSGLMDVSNEQARAAGLTLTDPEVTIQYLQAWMPGRNLSLGLSPEREIELIRLARC